MTAPEQPGKDGRQKKDRPWLMRTYAGHSSAEASNELYRRNLAKGQTGLSVAFDLPTQTGYDPDHILARGEVGRVGVPVCHLGDMRRLFQDIPLERMNTSMTINATAMWLLALYQVVAEEQGVDVAALQGTTQNDIVKEYLSRGTHVFPPGPSLRLTTDMIAYTVGAIPKWNPINICSYHLQEAGATPVQEIAYAMSTAIAVLDAVRASGQVPQERFGDVVARISFFVNAGVRFIEEMCKMRAFGRIWDRITLERYGVQDPKHRRFRYGVQVNSLGLTEAQPENNIQRIVLEMLAVTLSKDARARAVQLPAWNEALGLPRPWDQQWSLRIQQVLAHESDLLEYDDIFAGSHVIEAEVDALVEAATAEIDRIQEMGGAMAAVESGYLKAQLVASHAERRARIEAGEEKIVGVNCYESTEPNPLTADLDTAIMTVDPENEARVVRALVAWRDRREEGRAQDALAALKKAAAGSDNLMAATLECARAGVTTGEWSWALRDVFGEFRAPTGVGGAPVAGGGGGCGHPARRRPGQGRRDRRRPRRRQAAAAGRQAGPGRAQQRRRADRRTGPGRRFRGDLPGDPAHPRADRLGGRRRGRALRRAVHTLRLARRAGAGRTGPAARGRGPRHPGDRRRDHPGRGRRGAARGRCGCRLHPEGLRYHRDHRPYRRRDPHREPARPPGGPRMTAPVNRLRPRRSCLAVPGSNPRFLEKAQGLPADQVFLDLEDACAPLAKPGARHTIVKYLNEGDWTGKTRVVRVNDWTTEWTYRDVVTVVEGAGPNLDCIMLPKVQNAEQIVALDLLLTQIEKTMGFEVGRIGIEAQIENAQGLNNVNAIAQASPRIETIIFGPADFMASINMKSLVVGEQPPGYPADAYHYILMKILMAARANDLQAIDGPYLQIKNVDGFREVAGRAAALGFDGKWVLHPGQVEAANEVFSPSQEDYDHAELILDAYEYYTSEAGGKKGSAMLGDEMIDEASRKMALVIAGKGRAAGMARTSRFETPEA
ncbi:putative methylmalonyl-CoA mutase alpha subunit [Streptomyces bingchenggensis BCW-1]|uniref:Putative methylmalonyl-CoA mutase alpha subunit n=2 Tax=Streptomyces TaxID=1883 RepID=D7C2S5_STRBB|nr:putative methylmalonyl-CoA mutase alpha subunit [Streptomyces bingchenggensis BCW-1]